ncbi:MAG: putative Ig domain-containing protein [Xanthomonadales bacterium]|nr:hypothetical protein [Anaerolineae bacterium]MCC6593007.1 putative Ig domain-containing protein [Xanthomonadales bacterium]MCE7932790.1 hypothetical protein [Xanthomonadales bacterium PRO6]
MAQPDLRTFDRRGILIGPANTTLTKADHSLLLFEGSAEFLADRVERNIDTAHLGAKPSTMRNHRAKIMGSVEIIPPATPGTLAAPYAKAILCCAIAQTLSSDTRITRYTPVSSGMPLADAQWWHAGIFADVYDIAGDLSEINCEIGQRITAKLDLEGPFDEISEDDVPSDFVLTAFVEPTVCAHDNSTLILNSLGDAAISDLHLRAKQLRASFGNEKAVKEYTEYKKGQVSKRAGSFSFRIADTDLDDFNPEAFKRSRELLTLEWKLSESDGRYTIVGVRGQVDEIKRVDIEGDTGWEISGPAIPSSSGNDEIWIEHGDDTFALNGTLNGGVNGVAYVADGLVASGVYTAPLTWDISTGTLPTGLSINASTGQITGTPSGGAGTSNFTVRATDSTSGTALVATKATSIVVA